MWAYSEMCDWDNLSKKQKATFRECEKHSKMEMVAPVCPAGSLYNSVKGKTRCLIIWGQWVSWVCTLPLMLIRQEMKRFLVLYNCKIWLEILDVSIVNLASNRRKKGKKERKFPPSKTLSLENNWFIYRGTWRHKYECFNSNKKICPIRKLFKIGLTGSADVQWTVKSSEYQSCMWWREALNKELNK